ncbi:MAG: hypothetical protein ABW208_25085 [Pyrinomonadaceae bacterium]
MKKPRRTDLRTLLLLALLPACVPHVHGAQERRSRAPQTKAKQTPKPARDPKERERRERQQAVAALNEAVAAAPEVKDSYKRTLLLALAAEALWTFDEQAARSLFARAWEAAAASDEEESSAEEKRLGEQASARSSADGLAEPPEALSRVTRARREVLSAASRRDARLTERYLAELRESIERRGSRFGEDVSRGDSARRRYDARDDSVLDSDEHLRLDLSRSLAEEGEYSRAAEVAAHEVAGGVSSALVRFLIGFRGKAPAEADALFRQLLARTANDPRAGVNDVLLLSSYVLTPSVLTTAGERGGVSLGYVHREGGNGSGEPAPPRAVRQEFFNTAAAVLLRAGAEVTAGATGARGRTAALFYALSRLLPFFEREAPQLAPQMHALRQSVAGGLSEESRAMLASVAETTELRRLNAADPLANDFEHAKTEPEAAARDAARERAVRQAVKLKLWARAREAIAGMEDAELRANSLNLLAVCQVAAVGEAFDDDDEGDVRAAQFVENGDVPPLTRALGYAQAALLASKLKRHERAAELLERARYFAEQTDSGKEARFVALLVVAAAAEQADPARAWEMLPALVRAANEVGDAPADELSGGFRVPSLEGAENVGLAEQLADFRLDHLFAALGRRDIARALREARSLADATTRSLVTVATARARLAAGNTGARRAGAR